MLQKVISTKHNSNTIIYNKTTIMNIEVNNKAGIANKYIRLAKWKLYALSRRFSDLCYAKIFVQQVGKSNTAVELTIILGIPGNDIILKEESSHLSNLIKRLSKRAHRYLNKNNERRKVFALAY